MAGNGRILSGARVAAGAMWMLAVGCGADGASDPNGQPGMEDQLTEQTPGSLQSSNCPLAPTGTAPEAAQAFEAANKIRVGMGLGCLSFSAEIADAARNHCSYYTSNKGKCTAKPHNEDPSCTHYTGERFSERLSKAGYKGAPAYEVMTYVGNGNRAVQSWVDSIWHRLPFVSPRVRDAGYGNVGACDTMDFGYGAVPGAPQVVYYPSNGQTNVPTSFGGNESPEPPKPPKGWPSGYPVTLVAPGLKVTSHLFAAVGGSDDGKPVDHTFIGPDDQQALGLLRDEFFLYAHKPLKSKTKYRVAIEGTLNGAPAHHEWTFTTR